MQTLVGVVRRAGARRIAPRLPGFVTRAARELQGRLGLAAPPPPPPAPSPELRDGSGPDAALAHLRAACRALAPGRSHADLFRELRLLVNRLEAGGLHQAPSRGAR
jgi:hypothetical protein